MTRSSSGAHETLLGAVRVVHQMPGRTRLRVLPAQRGVDQLAELELILRALPGVQAVNLNVTTGTVVVTYDRAAAVPDELSMAASIGVDLIPPRLRNQATRDVSRVANGITAMFREFDQRTARATDGWVDLKMLVPIALFGAAIAQATAAEVGWTGLSPYVLGYYAFDTFVKFHRTAAPGSPSLGGLAS